MSTALSYIPLLGSGAVIGFGIGFVAPLIAQSLDAASMSAPLGLTSLQLGLAIGTSLGLVAKLRGSWV